MNRELTREEALRLHRKMWQDMRTELGDDPCKSARLTFKKKWIKEHFPNEDVRSNCFLCEYAQHTDGAYITGTICDWCPIAWNSNDDPECAPGYLSFFGRWHGRLQIFAYFCDSDPSGKRDEVS